MSLWTDGRKLQPAQRRDAVDEGVRIQRLEQVILKSRREGVGAILRARESREGDRGQSICIVAHRSQLTHQLVSILLGHADIADEQVGVRPYDALHSRLRVSC